MKEIQVPISPGELLDKITILRIKAARMEDPAKVANVRIELDWLERVWRESGADIPAVRDDERELQRVNAMLWEVEDQIRDQERAHKFDARFIELARTIYVTNDLRAAAKRRINMTLGSTIVEEKSYKAY